MLEIAVLLSGRGSNFISLHKAILDGRIQNARIACVISNKEDAPGLQYACENGIEALFISPKDYKGRELFDRTVMAALDVRNIGLVCLAGYMRIVTEAFVERWYGRMLNIHPSLLPSFPGLHAQKQALDAGVRFAGCTVHFVDKGVDTGPIISQAVVPVFTDDTEEGLSKRILQEEHRIYPEVVSQFASGSLSLKDGKVRTS